MKTIYCKFIFLTLFPVCSFPGISQTQTAVSWTLDSAQTGTKDYVARDYITLKPGFSYTASAGNTFNARIDRSLLFPLTDGLYMLPDGTFTNDPKQGAAVGSIPGQFDVSPTGTATYSIPIEAPQGIQGMQPNVSLVYNSQSGNGIAGWGCNLSGLSAITRAPKNIYHDTIAKPLTYTADDAYYLDGKRLIYSQGTGTVGQEGAVYYSESDPFTKIIVHGTYNTTTVNTWFEVQASNGMKYYYGSTASGRQSYTTAGTPTRAGLPRILAWYLDYVEDPPGNYMSYSYNNRNNYLYPNVITYGSNKNQAVSSQHTITFGYETRSDVTTFVVEGVIDSLDSRLKTITTKTGSSVYRTYELQYDNTTDGSGTKYSRLTAVTEKNGAGEALKPTTLNWTFLPAFTQSVSQPAVSAIPSGDWTLDGDPQYFADDLDGDGLTDLVWFGKVKKIVNPIIGALLADTYVYIYHPSVDASGNVTFTCQVDRDSLGENFMIGNWSEHVYRPSVIDFNGDGIKELLVPNVNSGTNRFDLRFVGTKKSNFDIGTSGSMELCIGLDNNEELPLYSTGDVNNNGSTDIIILKRKQQSGKYPCYLYSYKPFSIPDFFSDSLSLLSKPEKMFLSDFNGDGLCDMLVFYNGGYTIFWNQGTGISTTTFSDSKTATGTNITNVWRIWSGDFNGDGLMDFLMNATMDSNWYFALNNGDGTFTKKLACTLSIYDQNFTGYDDDKFDCFIYDFDFDGKSDIVITKSMYIKKSDISGTWGSFDTTYTYWLRSTGSSLMQVSSATSKREADAFSANYVLGDFNGDGQTELMNYGYNCYNSTNTNANLSPVWRLYKNNNFNIGSGKVASVTDGYGSTTSITYASLVTGGIYTKDVGSPYPMADYTLPLHAVNTVTANNGAAGTMTTNYQYGGLKAHLQGKGLLGFSSVKANNTTLGTTTESGVKSWNGSFFIPSETYTKTTVDGKTAETSVVMSVNDKGAKKYFAYPATQTDKDLDGNTVTTTRQFNTTYGYPTEEKADFGNSMYKTVQYTDYILSGGAYQPQTITRIRKHSDDVNTFTQKTKITYDATKGYKKQVIDNYGSTLPLTTDYTYDNFGNVKTSKSSGSGVSPVTSNYDYDASGRFVIKTYTAPVSPVHSFVPDTWGNVLTEKDETNPSATLTTTHTYDNWGRRTSTVLPDETKTIYQWAWGTTAANRYFSMVQGVGAPWVKTWYDNKGRKALVETVGPQSMKIQDETVYNAKGQVYQQKATRGNIVTTDTYVYDARGRTTSYSNTAGQSVSYKYGNRKDTTVTNGRTYTKIYDAWGNIQSSADPQDTVRYTYYSLGKPKTVTSGGAAFSMDYYDTGMQKTLKDPNAGTITYEYNADGQLKKQTDGRGKVTSRIYDRLGRDSIATVDGVAFNYFYGEADNARYRLTKQQTGNNSIVFTYDNLGRIQKESRQIDGGGTPDFTYAYNSFGLLDNTTYPNNLQVSSVYDVFGNLQILKAGSQILWELTGATGTVTTEQAGGAVNYTTTLDSKGLLSNLKAATGSTLYNTTYSFDGATGNLSSRTNLSETAQSYLYDNLDRLTTVQQNGSTLMSIGYLPNGNIDTKTGLGKYSYGDPLHVHAVTFVQNTGNLISSGKGQTINYNGFNKVYNISDTVGTDCYKSDFIYGPDQQRWKTTLTKNSNILKTILFAGDYEKVTANGIMQELYYIGDKVLYVKQAGQPDKIYCLIKDHLGSIVKIIDNAGATVFAANYDVWGQQTVTNNTFAFHRGFTGHEHLPEFNLINMNGRVYDPILGRFLSPDPFVQAPDLSQNFNRYTYCLNNPLRYTDPNGEWFGIDDLIVAGAGFIFGYVGYGISTDNWGWKAVAAGGMGAVSAWLGYNTMGGSTVMSGWQYAGNQAINTALGFVTPSYNFKIGDVNMSLSPVAMFSTATGFRFGAGLTASYKMGDWTLSVGTDFLRAGGRTGFGTFYGGASYDDGENGFSFYATKYMYGAKQSSGILGLRSGDFSVNFEDDLFGVVSGGGLHDRYRTAALEVGYKNYYIGTQVITNDPGGEKSAKLPGSEYSKNKNGQWISGYQFTSALYFGYKNGKSSVRIGLNSPLGGYLGQNWWHRNLLKTADYKYLWEKNSPFLQMGSDQFYTLF